MTIGVAESNGTAEFCCIRRQGYYVLIAVTPKGSEPERYWLSVGGAEVLAAEINGALRTRTASSGEDGQCEASHA